MNPIIQRIQDQENKLQKFVDKAVFPKSREQQDCEQEIRKTILFLKDLILQLTLTLPNK
jgi:hypothetical protein